MIAVEMVTDLHPPLLTVEPAISDLAGKVKMKRPLFGSLDAWGCRLCCLGMATAIIIIICTYIAPFNQAPQSGLTTLIN